MPRHVLFCISTSFVFSCSANDGPPPDEALTTAASAAAEQGACTTNAPARWREDETISPCGRANPLQVSDVAATTARGREHVLHYPVEVTGIVVPYRPLLSIVEGDTESTIRKLIAKVLPYITGIHGLGDLWKMLGLVVGLDGTTWGVTVLDTPKGEALTFSCATCHTGSLFGTPVFGLFNRRSRANSVFERSRPAFEVLTPKMFDLITGATDGERQMWADARENMKYVQSLEPRAVGLDTALAHTMLSLARRDRNAWATRSEDSWQNPRPTELETHPVDVKPATWWLTKYKTRFFSDGSLVSGNPVIGALVINEIGRGTDLHVLDEWIDHNAAVIEELTTAVFQAEAPSFFDFFDAEAFDLDAAKRGQALFQKNCERCHGAYAKGWDGGARTLKAQLATTSVRYFERSLARNVGTDPDRAKGIAFMQDVNALALMQKHNVVLTEQPGYLPPPLVGVFARWPYFHNGSAPSLCAVLTRAEDRPSSYRYSKINDRDREFDSDCNGFPVDAPESFTDVYDTSVPGLTRRGHDEGIFLKQGKELMTLGEKRDLIRFLQTL